MDIILGSQSPRRRELLSGMGVVFRAVNIHADESFPADLKGADIPLYISRAKAEAYRSELRPGELLITADEWDKALKTAVEILERRIPKKPREEVVNDEIVALSCPICGSVVGYKSTTTRRIIRVYGKQICNRCGQSIN